MLTRRFAGRARRSAVVPLRNAHAPRRTLKVSAYKQDSSSSPGAQQRTAREPNRVLKASLDTILARYYERTPSATQVVQKVFSKAYGADQVINDHFAFRTFGVPGLGIEPLGAALEAFGYKLRDFYTFPRTHLLAAWYAPPQELYGVLPRMFVSQLQVQKLSPQAQAIIHSYTDELTAAQSSMHAASTSGGTSSGSGGGGSGSSGSSGSGAAAGSTGSSGSAPGTAPSSACSSSGSMLASWTAAVTHTLPWRTPSREDYTALLNESEYAAWVLVNGYNLNHTALSVHHLADIYAFANDLVMKGFSMNEAGGIMKVSPDSGLLQCSTVADLVDFQFADGQVHKVVGAYMEFVERKVLPQHEHLAATGQLREQHRRDGFEAESARGIFASTTLAAAAAQKQGML